MVDDIVIRLRERARIRRQIPTRKSVQEGQSDRIADLLDEAAKQIEDLRARPSEACIIDEYDELCRLAKRKGLIVVLDDYNDSFLVKNEQDHYKLIGNCKSLAELAVVVLN